MEKLIPLINEIHDILYQSNLSNQLELPQIVVLGAQSVGKSSVLESIIGRDFLPRGKGIVTRRPIEIQLINLKEGDKEWIEFLDKKGEKVYSLEEVKQKIEQETEKLAGKFKSISPVPIKIKFFSPNVVDLLLVDLPGMTKNPVGDQPKDIEDKIKELLHPYIKNPNSLILAVSKANDDLANSESLKLARDVDSEGKRTIGVITQLDIMDQGQDVMNDLLNKTYQLRLGYVGVVCRGQKDKQNNKSIENQVEDEKIFFENHKVYSKYQDRMGIPYLIKQLNVSFITHIKQCLPFIRENLIQLMKLREYDLKQYGNGEEIENKEAKGLFVLSLISKYGTAFSELIKGKYLQCQNLELVGGSRVNYIFVENYRKTIDEIDPFDIINDEDIRIAIRNANGLRPALFVPESAFENLVKQQIMRLQAPSLDCSHQVYDELRRILRLINIPDIERYENLHANIFRVMEQVLQKCLIPADEMIKNLIEIELGYINTNHPDFLGGTNALISLMQDENENEDYQDIEVEELKRNQQKIQLNNVKDPQIQIKKEKKHSILDWLPFTNKAKSKADEYDSKLNILNQQKGVSDQRSFSNIYNPSSYSDYQYQDSYNVPKKLLPQAPSSLKIYSRPTKREQTEIDMIKKLIVSYFNVVKKNVNDSIPKTIITLLVNQSRQICERELISNLYKPELFNDLLEEKNYVRDMRIETKKILTQLRSCLNVLNSIDSRF